MSNLDKDGQPPAWFHWENNELKAINTLFGLCMGVIADGQVNDSEILFLDTWLRDHEQYLESYPLNVVHNRIQRILNDGVISQSEREDLYQTLGQLLGGTPEETGAAGGLSTQLPVDSIDAIDFDGAVFCFTGKFIFGQRSECERAVIEKGAVVVKSITKKLDYLVIGDLASRDWIASSHGRKIEKALQYKEQGSPILILSERDWVGFVQRNPIQSTESRPRGGVE